MQLGLRRSWTTFAPFRRPVSSLPRTLAFLTSSHNSGWIYIRTVSDFAKCQRCLQYTYTNNSTFLKFAYYKLAINSVYTCSMHLNNNYRLAPDLLEQLVKFENLRISTAIFEWKNFSFFPEFESFIAVYTFHCQLVYVLRIPTNILKCNVIVNNNNIIIIIKFISMGIWISGEIREGKKNLMKKNQFRIWFWYLKSCSVSHFSTILFWEFSLAFFVSGKTDNFPEQIISRDMTKNWRIRWRIFLVRKRGVQKLNVPLLFMSIYVWSISSLRGVVN